MDRFDLPEGWEIKKLGDREIITLMQPGFACGRKDISDGVPHLRMNNIAKAGYLNMGLIRRIPKQVAKDAGHWLSNGDVLFCNTNSTELVGKSCVFTGWNEPCTFSNHLTQLKPNEKRLNSVWLQICIYKLWESGFFASNCVEFIGQSAFKLDKLKAVEIPVPPLAEQQRIVARIEELTRRVEEASNLGPKVFEDIEKLISAEIDYVFLGLLDTVGSVPLGCHVKIQGGFAFKSAEYRSKGLPLIRISNLTNETVHVNGSPCIDDLRLQEFQRFILNPGDILIAMTGATTGKLGIVPEACHNWLLNQRVGKFVSINPSEIEQQYVYWLARNVQRRIFAVAYGGAQPNISPKDIEAMEFPFPPLADQRRIVDHLNIIQCKNESLRILQKKINAELASFVPALLAKAFRGEL